MNDATLRENLPAEATLRETPPDVTIREGTPASSPTIEGRSTFRGLTILEQLPTRGAEADIFLLKDGAGEKCILKLYRHRLEPKIEVLERIREVSRAHADCFVVFRDAGFDETTGRWFEVQEYMPLGSLRDVPPELRRDPRFIKKLVSELAEAIHCLHENGIIHCDIKPGNVLVRSIDPPDLVLTDFGIASLLAADVSQKMTGLKGTPMYWAPEAFSRMAGRPGDWWGLGMIVLELLSGEHPFSTLTDSQIIHRLTIGNVEIPDSAGDEWEPLLRGLLTKDDSKRWGYDEVVRQLAGERDIPVYYEAPARLEPERKIHPFRFEAKDYYTPRELARMLCGREQPWAAAGQFLRYIRSWLESNMMFDEAVELGNDADRLESDAALFRFVHRHAQGPFAYLGKIIDADGLKLFLARSARQEASFSEQRIVRMMGDGSLAALYDTWTGLTGRRDPRLPKLLSAMRDKDPTEQWLCFRVLENPVAFLWPKDANADGKAPESWTEEEALDALSALGTLPLERSGFDDIRERFVLPNDLLTQLGSVSTCAAGTEWLRDMSDRELLIPRGTDPDGDLYGALTPDEYVARANVICMGHSEAFLKSLYAAAEGFDALPAAPDNFSDRMILLVRTRLSLLKKIRVAPYDTLYVNRLIGLFSERRKLSSERLTLYPISAVSGALVIGTALALLGRFGSWIVYGLALAGLLWIAFQALQRLEPAIRRGMEGGSYHANRQAAAMIVLPFAGVVLGLVGINGLFRDYPRLAWGLSGAMIGCAGCSVCCRILLNRSFARIAELCGDYSTAFGGNPDAGAGPEGIAR